MSPKEEYRELFVQIRRIIDNNSKVLVEGKNDKKALLEVGIRNINLLETHYKTVEKLQKETQVIILTDLDNHGNELFYKLYNDLTSYGVYINNTFRNFLSKNTKLRQIEGLTTYLKNLKKDF
jgi:5S rRNA maturation endonuclease (ribonuclease M5)